MKKTNQKIKIIKRRLLQKTRLFELVQDEVEINGQRIIRETFAHPGAVVIVPKVDARHVLFVKQYRHAVGKYILELPAGTLEPRERPLDCAKRELAEEVGRAAKRWKKLSRFYAAPGYTSEALTLYLAESLTPVEMNLDEDEILTPVILSLKEARSKLRTGAICDAKTMIGLLSL